MKNNAQVVAQVKRIAEELNREVATIAQAREMLGLPPETESVTLFREDMATIIKVEN